MLCTLVVVQFSMTDRLAAPSRRLDYYTTPPRLCQEVFQTFFKSFFAACPLGCIRRSRDSLIIILHLSAFVNTFLQIYSQNTIFQHSSQKNPHKVRNLQEFRPTLLKEFPVFYAHSKKSVDKVPASGYNKHIHFT